MSAELIYFVCGAGLLLATVLPRVLHGRAFSVPMVVLAVGVLAGVLIPGDDPLDDVLEATATTHIAEACVIISLMGVGLAIDRPLRWRTWGPTWRLLVIAMPLCIGGVALVGWWAVGLSVPAAVLLGAVLAPTDPVLASEVQVAPPTVEEGGGTLEDQRGTEDEDPEEDAVRFTLTSEAGLNDAFAFPFVYFGLFLMDRGPLGDWLLEWVLWTLVGKIVVGAVVGWLAGAALGRMAFRATAGPLRIADGGNPLLAIAATFAVYGLTELVGGYGFLAVFAAALAIRSVERGHGYHRQLHELVERLEAILTLVLLLMLGAAMGDGLLVELSWAGVAVAVALVVVIRPVLAWLSLAGAPELQGAERWAVAAFGVRGIGSVYYLSYALGSEYTPEQLDLWAVVGFTIVLSVIVHGAAATPVMRWLDRRRQAAEPVA
ncbi:cation:proton antiporter [Egicoccus sp. AB-alg6-2]|uniref:cation:proton antiporter n=1 Tax=Egicoccus sp. AB-alg6-2 TaxID=3242692 RepID=UPI00359EE5E1